MTDIAELERRVTALEAEVKHHKTRDDRIVGILTELKEDTALLRRHAIASGQKIEQLEDRIAAVQNDLAKRMDRVEDEVKTMRSEMSAMRKEFAAFPSIVADALREVLKAGGA